MSWKTCGQHQRFKCSVATFRNSETHEHQGFLAFENGVLHPCASNIRVASHFFLCERFLRSLCSCIFHIRRCNRILLATLRPGRHTGMHWAKQACGGLVSGSFADREMFLVQIGAGLGLHVRGLVDIASNFPSSIGHYRPSSRSRYEEVYNSYEESAFEWQDILEDECLQEKLSLLRSYVVEVEYLAREV